MFALRSARLSGLNVPAHVLKGCRKYLDAAAADTKKITYSYMPGRPVSPVMTAEALLSPPVSGLAARLSAAGQGRRRWSPGIWKSRQQRNIYYWYYATQLLHNMKNKDWKDWNVRVRDGLVGMQTNGAGCARGSWDPVLPQPDLWASRSAGRLYVTALSTLTLEVYYRYLPLYAPNDEDKLKLDADDKADKLNVDKAEPPPATAALENLSGFNALGIRLTTFSYTRRLAHSTTLRGVRLIGIK